ncbi:hypothetical protein [Kordia sp.]|uniref:hypothetical protein n=1 Tax=Kordia sp. TaxID=1965332 RepID=UPI003D284D23
MKNLKTIFTTYLLLFFAFAIGHAQHTIKTTNIDLITLNERGNHIFYKKIDSLHYQEVEFELQNYTDNLSLRGKIQDDELIVKEIFYDTLTMKEIQDSHTFITKTDEMTSIPDDFLTKTSWDRTFTHTPTNEKELTRFINKDIAVTYEISLQKNEKNHQENNISWKVKNTNFLFIVYLEVRQNKQLLLLFDTQDIVDIIIPAKDMLISLASKEKITSFSKVNSEDYTLDNYQKYRFFKFSDYYRIHQNDNHSCELHTRLGTKVLPESYDAIYHSDFFIITKKDSHFTVYNVAAEKIPIETVYDFYFIDEALELLTDKGAFFYDIYGNHLGSFPNPNKRVWGGATLTTYRIDSKTNHLYATKKETWALQKTQKVILRNLPKNEEISFLTNRDTIYLLGNELFDQKYITSLLKVKNGKSYGIRSYKYQFPHDYEKVDTVIFRHKQLMYRHVDYLDAKQELPTQFDSIALEKNGIIRFYKNNKVGIFPTHRTVQYDLLEKVTDHFYRIRRKKKRGWLNIGTMEEFFFD